ncbi:ras association domain-containing protein 8 [Periophthalmus magnuspinnatus]|uniref:ras association domain-containing protein 8 n=1 Tax=Periophthalmus magnuspinnatus TaxID=409849 RepID=UPI0024367A9F|nr:ras association domain-containing protein 8 [Periophthalmus magnuspinnatus]
MEVKVIVNGLPRVICGLTKDTTCQDVVIALAQALRQPGRYTLREKFKDFERCMTPSEHVLETLERYGELARDVQLTLIHNGPAGCDPTCHSKMGKYQPFPPLRRKDPGTRLRRGSSSLSLHRQSLPPLDEKKVEDVKRPKRKSLTIMEEAWEWLENLGKGKVYRTSSKKDICKKSDKMNRTSLEVTLSICKDGTGRNSKAKVKNDKVRADLDNQTSCCIKTQPKATATATACRYSETTMQELTSMVIEDEKIRLIENILGQKSSLEDLKIQIANVDRQIFDLEEHQRLRKTEEDAKQRATEDELEQILFWENELKAEVGHEKDLQTQFLEIKERVMECKAKIQTTNFDTRLSPKTSCVNDIGSAKELNNVGGVCGHVAPNKKSQCGEEGGPLHALVAPSQIKERRLTGPTELREWWKHWSQAQNTQNKIIHRSELTIYLRSTKV